MHSNLHCTHHLKQSARIILTLPPYLTVKIVDAAITASHTEWSKNTRFPLNFHGKIPCHPEHDVKLPRPTNELGNDYLPSSSRQQIWLSHVAQHITCTLL